MLVALASIAFAIAPSAAAADTMPPGAYTVHVTSGSVRFGALPATPLPGLPPFEVALADQPVTTPLPFPYTFNVSYLGSITLTTTLDSGQATIDPATGAITADIALHTVLKAVPGPFLNVTGTCTYASVAEPITMHLATTPDSVWKLPDRAFTIYDNSYAIPAPICDDPTLQSLVVNAAGDTSAGHNSVAMVGTAARPEDAPPPPPPPPVVSGGSSSGGSGGNAPPASTPQQSGGEPESAQTPGATPDTSTSTPRCVVPRLKGRTLALAKRLLKRAGCRLGKVSKRKSRKHAGTVLRQAKKPGRKLPRGTRVALAVARH
jgi:hypothetical protein